MYCPKCGKEYTNEAFCSTCGTALPQNVRAVFPTDASAPPQNDPPVPPAEESAGLNTAVLPTPDKGIPEGVKAKVSLKVIGITATFLAVITGIIVMFILRASVSGGKFDSYSPNSVFYIQTEDTVFFFTSDGKKIGELDAPQTCVHSSDFSNLTVYDSDQNLNIVTSNGIENLGIFETYTRSLNGKFIIYTDKDGDWYWYDTVKREEKKISGIGYNDSVKFCSISPDGSAAAFSIYDEDGYEGFTCLYGQAPVSLGRGNIPLAISNGGDYIYYCRLQNSTKEGYWTLYVSHKEERVKLSDSFDLADNLEYTSLLLNNKGNQLIFEENGKSYITINGGEKQKLFSNSPFLIEPETPLYTADKKDYNTCVFYPISDLLDQCYSYYEGPVYFVDSKGESYKIIPDSTDDFQIADNNSGAIYLSKGNLVKVTDFVKGTKVDLTSDADADSFFATNDLSGIYYLENDELYYLKEGKKPVKIKDDVEKYMLAPDDLSVYVLSDGQLYIAKREKITPVEGLDTVRMGRVGNFCLFWQSTSDDEEPYMSSASELSPKKLLME